MKAKILVMILCLIIGCIPCYSMAEDMSFEGEWLAYVPMWSVYNTNKINLGDEFDETLEEFCSYALVEITDSQIVTNDFSLGDESISVNESYSMFFGEMETGFFQKIYDNLYGDENEKPKLLEQRYGSIQMISSYINC